MNEYVRVESWGVSRGTKFDRQAWQLNTDSYWSESIDGTGSFTVYGVKYILLDKLLLCKIRRRDCWEMLETVRLSFEDACFVAKKFVNVNVKIKPLCR